MPGTIPAPHQREREVQKGRKTERGRKKYRRRGRKGGKEKWKEIKVKRERMRKIERHY